MIFCHLHKKPDRLDCYNQHNCLFNLSLRNDAFYCAPLFHKRSELDEFNFSYYHHVLHSPKKKTKIYENKSNYETLANKFLSKTICIKPHRKINDSLPHSYSYDKSLRIVFHSEPEYIKQKTFLLSTYINELSKIKIDYSKKKLPIIKSLESYPQETNKKILIVLCDYYNYLYDTDYNYNEFRTLLSKENEITINEIDIVLEYFLNDNYNILQFGVYGNKEKYMHNRL